MFPSPRLAQSANHRCDHCVDVYWYDMKRESSCPWCGRPTSRLVPAPIMVNAAYGYAQEQHA